MVEIQGAIERVLVAAGLDAAYDAYAAADAAREAAARRPVPEAGAGVSSRTSLRMLAGRLFLGFSRKPLPAYAERSILTSRTAARSRRDRRSPP